MVVINQSKSKKKTIILCFDFNKAFLEEKA